jgi:hypothetical protein
MNKPCSICKKPVLEGQPHHGMTGNHWDCERMDEKVARAALQRADVAIQSIDRSIEKLNDILKGLR